MTLFSAAVLLILVMDPLGNVPLFLAALRDVAPARVRTVIVRELLFALALMLVFLFAGRYLLSALSISEAALTAGGGLILLLIALRMIFPSRDRSLQEEVYEEPFIVPLAIPYTAGPSVLATELLLMSQEPERWPIWAAAIVIAWSVSALILFFASGLRRVLGERGLTAIERLMGMVLVVVATEMLMSGIAEFLATS
ncbi:MAG TPA: MarC family protein [Longimicrobiales bacterium]|nr:MarC family protein [Longimicrobiales bacterium]